MYNVLFTSYVASRLMSTLTWNCGSCSSACCSKVVKESGRCSMATRSKESPSTGCLMSGRGAPWPRRATWRPFKT